MENSSVRRMVLQSTVLTFCVALFVPIANEAFIAQMRTALENVSTYAKAHGKLYCVSETGYTAIPEAGWWTGTLLKAVEGYSPCYLLVWRNAWDQPAHYFAPYEGSLDSENFKEFVASGRPKLLTEK